MTEDESQSDRHQDGKPAAGKEESLNEIGEAKWMGKDEK